MNRYLDKVLRKINASGLPVTRIAKETQIDKRWLYQLVNRKIQADLFERIMTINDFLDEHQENLARLKHDD